MVDDHVKALRGFKRAAEEAGAKADGFGTGEELVERGLMGYQNYLLDASLPGVSGVDLALEILEHDPSKLVVIISGHRDLTVEAVDRGLDPSHVFEKPLKSNKSTVFGLVARSSHAWEAYATGLWNSDQLLVEVLKRKTSLSRHQDFVAMKRQWRQSVVGLLLQRETSARVGMVLEIDRLLHTRSFVPSDAHDLQPPTKEELIALRGVLASCSNQGFTLTDQAHCESLLEEAGWVPGLVVDQ